MLLQKRYTDRDRIRNLMDERGVKKVPGETWCNIDGDRTSFVVNDTLTHPHVRPYKAKILAKVQEFFQQLKAEGRPPTYLQTSGHVPHTEFVLHEMEEEEKEQHLMFSYSEKLALAYSMLRTPEGTRIVLFKNLRICGDW